MSLWRQLTRGLGVLTDRTAADRDVADEVRHYLDESTAAGIARGLPPEEARRAAHLELGSVTTVREAVRNSGWEMAIETTLADIRYAARRLRRNPGFTFVSVLTLALGIGASTAIFSVIDPILIASLPYPQADRVTAISDVGRDGTPEDVTFGTYLELAERSRSFTAMAVFRPWQPALIGAGEPEQLRGQQVGAGYFQVLGVAPALGRDFVSEDDRPNGPAVVILSGGLWRRRFNADPGIVGQDIRLDGNSYLVLGVMPRGFDNVLAPSTDIWTPLQFNTSFTPDSREWGHQLQMIARLRPGVGIEEARQGLQAIARAPIPEFPRVPWASLDQGLIVQQLQDAVTRGVRPTLLAISGAVLLLLLIAGVNVTNLLLGRGAQRRGEIGMRAALGAGRGRLIRQLLTETLLLTLVGGVCGVAVAVFGVRALVALSPPGLPRIGAIAVNGVVLGFGIGLAVVVGLACGLLPALHAARSDLHDDLRRTSQRATHGHPATRGALVVAEVALALMLLVSTGLLLRSLERLFAVTVGFAPAGVLTLQVRESGPQFASDSARYRFLVQALETIEQQPGVTAAAFTSQLPLSGGHDVYGTHFEDDYDRKDDNSALRYAVTPQYLAAMGIPLLRGRWLGAQDAADAPRAAVISQSLARRKFPGRDPMGQRVKFGTEWYAIVGVVGDVKQTSLAAGAEEAIYVTPMQWQWVDNVMSLVVRTRTDPAALAPAVRRAIWSVDKDPPITRVATMDEVVARSEADRHFALVLFEVFGGVALVLAAVGIYGVLSGGVTERIREIGVRSALGASRGSIVALVVRQGMTLTLLGAGIGVVGAVGASQGLATLLYGISRLDPVTYLGVVAVLIAAAAVACWVPAWRAARVDPVIALRAD